MAMSPLHMAFCQPCQAMKGHNRDFGATGVHQKAARGAKLLQFLTLISYRLYGWGYCICCSCRLLNRQLGRLCLLVAAGISLPPTHPHTHPPHPLPPTHPSPIHGTHDISGRVQKTLKNQLFYPAAN